MRGVLEVLGREENTAVARVDKAAHLASVPEPVLGGVLAAACCRSL